MAKYFYDRYRVNEENSYMAGEWIPKGTISGRAMGLYDSITFDRNRGTRGSGEWRYDDNIWRDESNAYEISGLKTTRYSFRESGRASNYLRCDVHESNDSRSTTYSRGALVQANVIAEDGTYPANGRHNDGYWYVKKGLANQAPTISGKDEDLGDISYEINYPYTVFDADNNTLSIVERLNNTVINVRNAVKSGTEFTLNIPKETIYSLPIGVENRISIEVSDGTAKAYRNLTFTRTNTAPIIQVLTSKDLGEVIEPFNSKIKVTDEEGDKVDLLYTVNQVVLDKDNEYKRISLHTETKEDIELNTEIDYNIPSELFKTMNIGNYELSIKAIDAEGGENEEVIKFTRTEDTIDFETKPIETEVMPKQFISLIQLTGSPSNIKIMACNNGLDTKPSWEDVTENALKNTPYNFTNTSKTGDKWAIKIKVYLDGKEVK